MLTLKELLEIMVKQNASDLHITVGTSPQIRIDGKLVRTDLDKLSPEDTKKLAYSVMNEKQRLIFEENSELDLSFGVKNLSRFRCNIFMQRGNVAMALRQIPHRVPTFEELGIPPQVVKLSDLPRGLILVTGPTGSGKSTTLAAQIDKINREQHKHIITVEDPIEYLHAHHNCLINQREIHADTHSFAASLKYALRQDPDVILILSPKPAIWLLPHCTRIQPPRQSTASLTYSRITSRNRSGCNYHLFFRQWLLRICCRRLAVDGFSRWRF
jgi:twitching motility protein PilT